jgi:hypothetical protein
VVEAELAVLRDASMYTHKRQPCLLAPAAPANRAALSLDVESSKHRTPFESLLFFRSLLVAARASLSDMSSSKMPLGRIRPAASAAAAARDGADNFGVDDEDERVVITGRGVTMTGGGGDEHDDYNDDDGLLGEDTEHDGQSAPWAASTAGDEAGATEQHGASDEGAEDVDEDDEALTAAEQAAAEAGRRIAAAQQQRLLQQHSDSMANRRAGASSAAAGCGSDGAAAPAPAPSATRSAASSKAGATTSAGGASEVETLRKNLIHTTAALDKERARSKEAQLSLSTLQLEMQAMKRELAVVHRVSGPGGSGPGAVGAQAKEVATLKRQLQVAQGEAEQLRALVQQLQATGAATASGGSGGQHAAGTSSAEVARLRSEVRSLETQRAELLGVVRKQARLVDVLRRQKMHLEAAKLLQITEDEFRRALQVEQYQG